MGAYNDRMKADTHHADAAHSWEEERVERRVLSRVKNMLAHVDLGPVQVQCFQGGPNKREPQVVLSIREY